MSTKFSYWHFQSALSDEECDKIIELGNSKNFSVGTTKGNSHKQNQSTPLNDRTIDDLDDTEIQEQIYVRDSHVSWFNDQWVYDIVWPYLIAANNNAGWKYDFDIAENLQFTTYREKQFYGWHSDSNTDHHAIKTEPEEFRGKIRKLSMTVNLSREDEYEGGNLKFDLGPHTKNRYHECKEIRPRGSIVVFPSSVFHQVTPVTKGVRQSLVMLVLGSPFR